MADFFTFKKKIHDPNVMKPRPFCVTNIQRCIERKTSLLDGCKMYKFDDNASKAAKYELMLNGNGETVFQTTDKFQPLPELWAINRAEKMFSDGCSAAVKNKDGCSANKTSLIPMEYILETFVIKSDDQDHLGNDGNTAPHNETSDTNLDLLLCPEVKIIQDIAYEENYFDAETVSSELGKKNDFDAEAVSSELGKECFSQTVEETNGKEMSVTSLPETLHVMQMQAENPTSILNACQTRRNHGKQRLRQKGRQGRGQGYMSDRTASDCSGCQKLFKDSKQYFTNGDIKNGYYNLVKVLEFKHWSRQHRKILSKVTAFIIRKLGETCTDDNLNLLEKLLCQFDGDPVKFQFLNPKQVDAKGNGLFHLLAKCKFSNNALEAIKMLCARHLDPRVCNYKGKLPVDYIKNAHDERKQYLCIDVCPEVPKLECVSIETKSSANEKVAQIKIEEKTQANIIETVKSSMVRNNREIIEEMIKNMKKAKIKASKKFEKTLYTALPERDMCQAWMPSDCTESKLETREGDVETSMEKKEGSKSENTVDRYVVKANKGDENKESEYEDEETLDETFDASVFDNLAWEVDCTSEFWKKMQDKHITPDMKLRIIRRIQLLASGEWQPRLCKKLKNVPPNLQLYEAKVSKGGRVIWELAVAFSPRLNEMAAQPVKGGKIYSEIIRIWDIILDHGKLNRSIQRSAKRLIQAQIIGSYERGLTCIIPKNLRRNESLSTHTKQGHSVPILFTETEEDCLDNMLELQQKQLQKYFPHASPNKTEYHILKFYSFNLVSQYVLRNLSTKEPLDLPFRVTDQEHAIISLEFDAPILLLGRSGTGKTICWLYRLCSQFQDYWRKAEEAKSPLLPHTVCFYHLKLSEKMKDKETWDKMKKKEVKKKESEEVWKNDEKKLYTESGPVGVDNQEECTCSQYTHIHQVFVTRNPVLCTMVQKKFKEFCNANIHLDRATEKLPSRLQDIDEYSYPAFLTSHQLLLMLDASVGAPYFFDRKEDYSLKADLQGWMGTDGSDSIQSLLRKDSEMDVCNGSNSFRVDEDGKQKMAGTQQVFTDYNEFIKKHKNLFDETDLIHSIFRRLRGIKTIPWIIHQIFVDETQDFTQAELYLLIQICQDPNQMFLTGDTAQSIMRGISFRFEDLKALFFHAQQLMQAMNKREIIKAPEQYQLTHNYRSHAGILSLASSVLDLLDIFFPESFDKLMRDQGLFNGPQPIVFESSTFSDLAVLLRGNQRKTSQIEFGAHKTILVANEAARDAVPKELQFGLILTIYEAKGLEFDDVLLYNFFKDSKASKEWRLVTHYMEQLLPESKESTQGPFTSKKGLAKIYQDLMQQERSRPLTFDYNQHKVLNSELKHLYTALTRARVNLWIFDEDVEKRAPMFEYFKAKNLVRCLTLDEMDKSKLINTVFAESSSADDWTYRGIYFMKHNLYEAAAKCFEISGESSKQKAARAHHIALAAGKMRGKPQDMKEEFLKAAKLFLECNLPTKAAICLQNARERELAARLYENIGQFEKAAKIYYKLNNASESSRCLEISGNFNLAVQVLCKSENYDGAIDSLRKYAVKKKEFESRGNQVPQILIDCDPFKNFSEKYLNIMLADFHHRHNNLNKMLLTLERLPCWKDRVEFLKEKGHMDEAIQILEENGAKW